MPTRMLTLVQFVLQNSLIAAIMPVDREQHVNREYCFDMDIQNVAY